ncbi:PREDICTED: uncharacterized protein LOC104608981 [Nelumbo nucifera]|uniref:Senescence regulator S40 n=2 Tax=Nelumbo nucifera TaxID=4432 RepID=A0A822Z2K8_NELNU|nr:PREDICTED: uncharacterized protein LOC104608981 [Nelumbo nucifera]DAD37675.1 TPA_asm: hypothetical protein HUJ06_008316 [Nelumbo nucifera]
MADEEFQESEVFWPDHHRHRDNYDSRITSSSSTVDHDDDDKHGFVNSRRLLLIKKVKKTSSSVPVTIPDAMAGRSWLHFQDSDEGDDDYYEDGEMVPPHLLVSRRIDGKMAFSVCTGNGRTLKGRDLSKVRNSILRLTGFLES